MEANSNRCNQSDNENGHHVAVAEDLLLGYLCQALDETDSCRVEREIQQHPFLTAKLATLQKNLIPLAQLKSRTVMPPPQLAKRTCAKVWDTVDDMAVSGRAVSDRAVSDRAVSGRALARADSTTELTGLTGAKARPLTAALRLYGNSKPQRGKNRWIGFVASVALGMFLAFMIVPFLHFAKHSIVNTVRDNQRNAINERINPYEQINTPQQPADIAQETPINLGRFAWKEFQPNTLLPQFGGRTFVPATSALVVPAAQQKDSHPVFGESADIPVSFKQRSISDDILLTTPQGVQTGSGQDVLFKDGRIFFRDLPR